MAPRGPAPPRPAAVSSPCLLSTNRRCWGTLSPGRRNFPTVLSAHSLARPSHPASHGWGGPLSPSRGPEQQPLPARGGRVAVCPVGSVSGPSEGLCDRPWKAEDATGLGRGGCHERPSRSPPGLEAPCSHHACPPQTAPVTAGAGGTEQVGFTGGEGRDPPAGLRAL